MIGLNPLPNVMYYRTVQLFFIFKGAENNTERDGVGIPKIQALEFQNLNSGSSICSYSPTPVFHPTFQLQDSNLNSSSRIPDHRLQFQDMSPESQLQYFTLDSGFCVDPKFQLQDMYSKSELQNSKP